MNFNESTTPFNKRHREAGPEIELDDLRSSPPWRVLPTDRGQPTAIGPREIIRLCFLIFRSRWPLGLLGALTVMTAAGFLLFRRPIEVTAETTLLAQSPLDQLLSPESGSAGVADRQETVLKNHLSMMASRRFQALLLSSFSSDEGAAIQRPYVTPRHPESVELLRGLLAKNIRPDREREREFFIITAKHPSPEIALMMADRFASTYVSFVQEELHAATRKAGELLKGQADELSNAIVALQNERLEYRRKYNLMSVEANQDMLDERMKGLNAALSEIRMKEMSANIQVERAREDLRQSPLPFSNPLLANYGHNQVLRQELEALKTKRDVAAATYGPNHSKMLELNRSIESMEESLRANFALALQDLHTQAELSAESARSLEKEINATFAKSLELSEQAGRFNALGQTIESRRKTLDVLLQRLDKISVDSQLPVDVLRIIDPAFLVVPRIPAKFVYGAIILLLGAGAFISTTLCLNFFDETVNGSMNLEHQFGVRVLGTIPKLGGTRKAERAHVVRDNAMLPYVEAFLTVVSQISLVSAKPFPKRIIVTSALPGEGKSTIASNLAATFTRLGWKTVLVDADFRRPSQQGIHQIKTDRGLLTWAADGFVTSPDLFAAHGPLGLVTLPDGTSLIPAGRSDTQPSRFLIAPGMSDFLDELGRRFDAVVIDTPPARVFQDALIFARSCEETVFVVREGRASAALISRILVDFGRTTAPVIGLLLNRFKVLAADPSFLQTQSRAAADYYKVKSIKRPKVEVSA